MNDGIGRTHALLGSQYRLDGVNGQVINTDHERIAQMVYDYNPELRVAWVPPDKRGPGDVYPWALIHEPLGGQPYIVMNWTDEEMVAEKILAAIFYNDSRKHGAQKILTGVEAREMARQLEDAKKREDIIAERKEFGKAVLKSKLHTYKHGGKVYR